MSNQAYNLTSNKQRKELNSVDNIKHVIGGKATGLVQMIDLGMNVPDAMVITTNVCNDYFAASNKDRFMMDLVEDHIIPIMRKWKKANKGVLPLVSVRSGARVSMPGMMDTVLNVGISDQNKKQLKKTLGKELFYENYTRVIHQYGAVVNEVSLDKWLDVQDEIGVTCTGTWKEICRDSLEVYKEAVMHEYPQMAKVQILETIEAVFNSWNCDRAKHYRAMHGYDDSWGTAVIIQKMVYGNKNADSFTGVMFTRNPETGESGMVGEMVQQAQGEDIVAGKVTPVDLALLKDAYKPAFKKLKKVAITLEGAYRDVQDVEFTIEDGELFILQTRDAKRSPKAALTIATNLYREGVLNYEQYRNRVQYSDYAKLAVPRLPEDFNEAYVGKGIPASGGLVKGVAVFTSKAAVESKEPCILIRNETSPDDIAGIDAAVGIITRIGGVTSHAAVVARGMAKACIVGCLYLKETDNEIAHIMGNTTFTEGAEIIMDGSTGRIWIDTKVELTKPEIPVESYGFINEALQGQDGAINCTSLSEVEAIVEAGFSPVFIYNKLNSTVTGAEIVEAMNGHWGTVDFRGVSLERSSTLKSELAEIIGDATEAVVQHPYIPKLTPELIYTLEDHNICAHLKMDQIPEGLAHLTSIIVEPSSVDDILKLKEGMDECGGHRITLNRSMTGCKKVSALLEALEIEPYTNGVTLENVIYNFTGGA